MEDFSFRCCVCLVGWVLGIYLIWNAMADGHYANSLLPKLSPTRLSQFFIYLFLSFENN